VNSIDGKITVVGAGTIGTLTAYNLITRKSASEIVLVNRNSKKASVKAFDISHCVPGIGGTSIKGGSYEESAGSQVIIVTVGVLPKKNGSRMDVMQNNIEIYQDLIPKLVTLSPDAVLIIVTNPVDIMSLVAAKYSEFTYSRTIGSGTLLDSLRFRSFIAEALEVSPEFVNAMILGEHGESMVPIWSKIKIHDIPLEQYVKDKRINWNQEIKEDIFQKAKRAGWKIRQGNEHSSYAISYSATTIAEAIIQGSKDYFPVSIEQSFKYGEKDLFMSLPVQLGKEGYGNVAKLDLSNEEESLLEKSFSALQKNINKVNF